MRKEWIMNSKIYRLSLASVLAALYFVLTAYVFQPFSFLPVQFRVAEALMVLPVLTSAATPGLFLGCFLANLLNPGNLGPVDIILGSLATLLAALGTQWLGQKLRPPVGELRWSSPKLWLLTLPTIVFNGLIVGTYLPFLLELGKQPNVILGSIATVALGELVVLVALGLPLLMALKNSVFLKKFGD